MKSQRNKPRLLLALYARPKHPESYHYALLICPKITTAQNAKPRPATKYHVKNTIDNINDRISQPWRFERSMIDDINLQPRLLVCVVIGKIVSQEHVERMFGDTPVYQVDHPDKEKALGFDCRSWVVDAVERLRQSGVVSSLLDWELLERKAVEYVEGKKRMGRWNAGQDVSAKLGVPIMDLITGSEIST
ncbi:hypothetical protein BDV38DRAFT_250410 [Aspergillus pseudotamarii]|uniref:Uncharacterized protein n=1 Tax=Aspergillus pseudotamarii TaxID=132259 RepID=A0A5N6SMU7_ASPPS|nr:uncharacterized protein BDV38DRAFT_250410 [Aspergillus pseudotamarii]KAE8136018.1 hypothetical protein BDV38DRAFT_250410 [Aspergillus pseudotamarii]